ncbi:MAG: glycerol-3-phosphate 1-O-acyltransferase PlsY [Pseudomonadota bacterium]
MVAVYFIAAYLVGSVSSAILVCRAMGQPDPRSSGSGNPGATNVLRQSGKLPAFLTLVGDIAKGFVPVLFGTLSDAQPICVAALGAGAFIGHLFPVFFQFQGGKGVATLIGVLFGISWWLGLAFAACWLAVAAITRYSSLSALVAAASSPVFAWWLGFDMIIVVTVGCLVVLLFWRHDANIRKLLAGEESKIGQKKHNASPE